MFLFELHLHTIGRIYSAHLDILPQKCNMYLEKRELAMTRRVVPVTFGIVDLRKWLDLDDQYETLTHSAGQISLSPLISNGLFRVIDVLSDGIVTPNQTVRYCVLPTLGATQLPSKE
jgi:hypothetical protein